MKLGALLTVFFFGCWATISISKNDAPAETPEDESTLVTQIMETSSAPFGATEAGDDVTLFKCVNANGLTLKMIDYGATMVAMETPDQDGNFSNITLSCPDIHSVELNTVFLGCTVGRYCNRIAGGEFVIDGKTYSLAKNNGENHLHGGVKGWDRVMWQGKLIETEDSVGIRFTLKSPDGDEGYPGNVEVTAEYILNNENELSVEFFATTDQPTHVNLTNHAYWNLGGQTSESILSHELQLSSQHYVEVDGSAIPTGELLAVEETPFDFTQSKQIKAEIESVGSEPFGYDHTFVLDNSGELKLAATVLEPDCGRKMEVFTTQPGIHLYTGNYLDGSDESVGFQQHRAFCLETQHYPDSPNRSEFPSTLLSPSEKYHQKTVFKFSVEPSQDPPSPEPPHDS